MKGRVLFEPLEPRVFLSAATLGPGDRRFSFNDAEGNAVVVRLAGRGAAQITLDGDAADNADIESIVLAGTDDRTRLRVNVKNGGTGTIGAITGDSLGGLMLGGIALDGAGINLTGDLARLDLQALRNGADIIIGQAGRRPLNARIVDIIGGDDNPSTIRTAGDIGRLHITGQATSLNVDVSGDLRRALLHGEINQLNMRIGGTLGAMTVRTTGEQRGDLIDSNIAAQGGIGAARIDGSVVDSLLLAGTRLDDDFSLADATFDVASIKRVKIAGNVVDSIIAAGGDPGDDRLFAEHEVLAGGAIGRLDIGGVVAGLESPHVNPGIYAAKLGKVRVDGINLTAAPNAAGAGVIGSAVIDPLPAAENALEVEDDGGKIGIKTIIARAAARAEQLGVAATIAITDREGNLLTVVRMDGAMDMVDIEAGGSGGLEAVDGIVATSLIAGTKAGTASFLSTAVGNAFTTRTAGYIIQRHFPPGIDLQDGGPLFGVQLSSLPTSDVNRLPLGLSADPGGLPLYRGGELLGGIGVEVDGIYTVDPTRIGGAATLEERIALAGQIGLAPRPNIRADRVFIDGIRLDYANGSPPPLASLGAVTDYDTLVASGELTELFAPRVSPPSKFEVTALADILGEVPNNDLVDFFDDAAGELAFIDGDFNGGEQLTASEVETILTQGHELNRRLRAQIRRDRPQQSQVTVSVVDHNGNLLGAFRSLDAPVFGYDVSVQKARTAAFFSRVDAGDELRALDAELAGDIDLLQTLGIVDPSVDDPFARHADAAEAIGVDLDGTVTVADRTGGFLSRPNLPDGIDSTPPGPFSALAPDEFSPFNTGLQTLLITPNLVDFLLAFNAMDEADALAAFADGTLGGPSVAPNDDTGIGLPASSLANGMQIFAGSVPLYKDGVLVGGVGVSGDGIEQDDFVAFSGAVGFQDFGAVRRADSVIIAGNLRLPYVKFPRSPFGGF